MLKNEKSANRNDHQNRKTEVFCNKNRKTDLKNSQNRKTENPIAPLRTGYMISCHLIGLRKTKHRLGREKWRRCRVESRSKNTHDTIESFRSLDLSTFRTCGKFHRKVVFFIFLYWNYVTHRSSRTISFNQQPCLRLLRTM